MHVDLRVGCKAFPCEDVNRAGYSIPSIDLQPENIKLVLISEAVPLHPADDYYANGNPLFAQTTLQAFRDAGFDATSIQALVDLGVYLTSAVKCAKTVYAIQTATIKNCSMILENELALFPNVQAFLLMGDVAIKSINEIARRGGEKRVIPAGSTYKIRGGDFFFRGQPVLPSYLQAGPSFFIEKSKRRMIAEDIRTAMSLITQETEE